VNSFWRIVNKVISDADILILVLDARMVEETRNDEIESKVKEAGKPLIYVLNKCDLVDRYVVEQHKKHLPNSIFLSAKDHLGTTRLREKIMMTAAKHKLSSIKVGILGYPNVGKSSIINALKGRRAAPVSSMNGYTTSIRKVRSSKIILLDTPGVIPYSDTSKNNTSHAKHAMIGSIDHTKEKDPDIIAMKLLEEFPGVIEKYYGVGVEEDKEYTLTTIAQKRNFKSAGNKPDILRASRMILKDWQTGKITQKR